MSKYCMTARAVTNCTDDCDRCAKEIYRDLKGMAGKAEIVSEEAIKNELGVGTFELLKEYGHIEYCATLNGKRMYAI